MIYKPIVKWAGGKIRLLSQFSAFFPLGFNNYHEPFVGGGAVFFHLFPQLQQNESQAYLSDSNEELINLYQVIAENVEELICITKQHVYEKEYYYKIRALDPRSLTKLQRASRILYLNKTCFNGLYRVNRSGQFNVSFGDYTDPIIVDEGALRRAREGFQYAKLFYGDFETVLDNAQQGDFIYLDPPYVPVSGTANFTGYTKGSFGRLDQERLKYVYDNLVAMGCYVALSNSDSEFIRKMYSEYNIVTVHAARAINSDASKRGKVKELLILSYCETKKHLVPSQACQ